MDTNEHEFNHQTQAKGATHVEFRQRFARALWVQSLVETNTVPTAAQRTAALEQAAEVLDGLGDEAKQLHTSRQLTALIAKAQATP